MIKTQTPTIYKKITIDTLKKKVKDWAYSNLDKTIVHNPEFPHKIEFNKRGIQHTIYAKIYFTNQKQFNRDFLISIFHLKDLLTGNKNGFNP